MTRRDKMGLGGFWLSRVQEDLGGSVGSRRVWEGSVGSAGFGRVNESFGELGGSIIVRVGLIGSWRVWEDLERPRRVWGGQSGSRMVR